MKKLAIVLAAVALIAGFGLMKAEAALTDTIAVTVTLQNISVAVSPEAWTIGTIAPGAIVVQSPDTATNDGNVTENLTISVTNSANWTAGAAAAVNVFAMDVGPAGGPYTTNIPTAPASVTLTSGLAALGSYSFGLELNAPTAGSNTTAQSITVTVTAAAAA